MEQRDAKEVKKEARKLTPTGFQLVANTHLSGTNLLDILTEVNLGTDKNGNITSNVVANIKTMLKVAAGKTPDDIVKQKIGEMIKFMEDY